LNAHSSMTRSPSGNMTFRIIARRVDKSIIGGFNKVRTERTEHIAPDNDNGGSDSNVSHIRWDLSSAIVQVVRRQWDAIVSSSMFTSAAALLGSKTLATAYLASECVSE
jgi:hypothetical protein